MMTHPHRISRARCTFGAFTAAMALFIAQPAFAQAPAPGEADPGVKPIRMIDRAEVRVSRVEIQAGATRRVHAHDDVVYHLWIPIEGSLQITIGTDAPVSAASGQAFFMKRGTAHGFKNIGTTPGAALEIFIKQTTTARGGDPLAAVAGELAALLGTRPPQP
jgi:quercetin dioxygenase-like cupin family protein